MTPDALTVTPAQLEAQIRWLQAQRFTLVTAAQVIAGVGAGTRTVRNPVLITFDDAYVDTLELAQPVLERCGVRALVFVPTAFIGQESSWDASPRALMSWEQLRELAGRGCEIALHSHRHLNYRNLSQPEIEADIRYNVDALRASGLPWVPAFAYPYGGRPRAALARTALFGSLREAGISVAFRIGNRVNRWPVRESSRFEINRLSVRGDRDLRAFIRHVCWGRWFA